MSWGHSSIPMEKFTHQGTATSWQKKKQNQLTSLWMSLLEADPPAPVKPLHGWCLSHHLRDPELEPLRKANQLQKNYFLASTKKYGLLLFLQLNSLSVSYFFHFRWRSSYKEMFLCPEKWQGTWNDKCQQVLDLIVGDIITCGRYWQIGENIPIQRQKTLLSSWCFLVRMWPSYVRPASLPSEARNPHLM